MIENWLSEKCHPVSGGTNSEEEAEELWEVRRQGSSSMKKLASTKLNEDIVVPLDRQIELVGFVDSLRENYGLNIGVLDIVGTAIFMLTLCTMRKMRLRPGNLLRLYIS